MIKLFKRNSRTSASNEAVTGAGLGRRPHPTDVLPGQGRLRDSGQRIAQMGQNRTFSYYAARSQTEITTGREALQNRPPIRRLPTRLQRLRRHTGWLLLLAAVLGLVVYELQLSTTPKVVALSKSSDAPFLQESAVYQQAAKKVLGAAASNRNKLTVNTSEVVVALRGQFPELDEVSVALPILGSTPTIYVRPADPALILAAANGTFVIDRNGRALAEAGHSNTAQLGRMGVPTVTDQSSISVKLGQQVLPREAMTFVSTIVAQLKNKGIAVQSMTLPAAAGELDVYIAGKPYYVKFNLQQDGQQGGEDEADVQTGTFLAVKSQLERQGTQPGQYIDVRLEGRAYFR